ncbi:MAG: hypothetical protein WBL95_02330 [Microcoleus sp.]
MSPTINGVGTRLSCHSVSFRCNRKRYEVCPMPYALCPMPYALCPISSLHRTVTEKGYI